jgi:hypothetical protein
MLSYDKIPVTDFELRLEAVPPPADRPWVVMSSRLSAYRSGREVAYVAFALSDGYANIYGAWASDDSDNNEVGEALVAIAGDLGIRHGARPVLSIGKSRWPLAEYWPALRENGLVEIPSEFEKF